MTETFDPLAFALILALVGVVIMVAGLISGLIERSNVPQVAVFLALGAIIGPPGLGLLNVTLDSPVLRVVATLSLTLVLFTDAVGLNIQEVRKHAGLTALVLGPGTLLSAGLVAFAAWALVGLPPAAALIVGAALASTDPVLLRGLLRRRDIPASARQALRLESGMNDVVLLPIVLVGIALLQHGAASGTGASIDWTHLFLNLFLLGPGSGVAVGLLGVATLDLVRRRIGVRRDYESIYSLGVAFAAFAVAEAVHGSGFLAAFAAGLTIAALDVELCDCFLEYGETTSEMALLFTFVLFGNSIIWSGFTALTVTTAIFALVVLLIRPAAFLLALIRTRLTRYDRFLISWFGPRGLSTLLLVLLAVFDKVPGGEALFALCALVVLVSIVVHGGSFMLIGRNRPAALRPHAPGHTPLPEGPGSNGQGGTYIPTPAETLAQERAEQASAVLTPPAAPVASEPPGATSAPAEAGWAPLTLTAPQPEAPPAPAEDGVRSPQVDRITVEEMLHKQQAGERVVVIDARTERTFDASDGKPPGAVRIVPGVGGTVPGSITWQAEQFGVPRDAWAVVFCA